MGLRYVSTKGVLCTEVKHEFYARETSMIPHPASPLRAKAHGVARVSQCLLERIAQKDCSEGLLKRIALWALVGAQVGFQLVSQVGVSYAAYAGLRFGTGPWVLGTHRHGLGHKKAEAWARVSGGCARG